VYNDSTYCTATKPNCAAYNVIISTYVQIWSFTDALNNTVSHEALELYPMMPCGDLHHYKMAEVTTDTNGN